MVLPIQSVLSASQSANLSKTASVKPASDSFGNVLSNALGSLNQSQSDATTQVQQLINGNAQDLHNVTIALEKSDLMLKLAVNVRDKVVSAYQDVMRMQI